MPDPGRNIEVDVAQLSDELLETVIPITILNPAIDDEWHLIGYVPWPIDIVSLRAKAVGTGEAWVVIMLADNTVHFDEGSTGAEINTAGGMRAREGDFELYTASGGILTSGADTNEAIVGDAIKLKFQLADEPTGGLSFIGDLLIRRRRNVA